jgi:hypothetical protein
MNRSRWLTIPVTFDSSFVPDLLSAPVPIRDDPSFGSHGSCGWATVADTQVEDGLGFRFPITRMRRAVKTWRRNPASFHPNSGSEIGDHRERASGFGE